MIKNRDGSKLNTSIKTELGAVMKRAKHVLMILEMTVLYENNSLYYFLFSASGVSLCSFHNTGAK